MFPKLQELIDDRNHNARSAKDITDKAEKEGRNPTADESTFFDAHIAKVKELNAKIAETEAFEQRREQLQEVMDDLAKPRGRVSVANPPVVQNGQVAQPVWAEAKRYSTLKAFKGKDCDRRAYDSGMWLRATILQDPKAQRYCENKMGVDLRNALSTSSDPAGGYLVPEEFSQTIIDLREQYGVFRRECRVIPMGSDTMLIPRRAGGVTVAFTDENPAASIPESQPSWSQVRLTAKKLSGLSRMSTEVADDAIIDLADWLAQEFAYALALKEDQCGFIGDGTSTYGNIRGLGDILTIASGLAGAVDAVSGHDQLSEVDVTDITALMGKLPQYARANAKWYCSAFAMDQVFGRLMINAGGNTIQNMMGGYGPSFMGYPIVISQVLPAVGTAINNLPMFYFGDLSMACTMGDRRGLRILPSEHRYFELDQIGIRCTERFDLVIHDVGTTTEAGPIVALQGNT